MALSYKPQKVISPTKISRDIPSDKPIIFWDSCMLLYILTVAIRDSFEEFERYQKLLSWIEAGDVISVTSSIVWEEFTQHFIENKTIAKDDQNNLQSVLKSYASCIEEPAKARIIVAADSLDLVSILEDIEKRVWRKTYVINDNASLRNLAHFRVLHKMSPSKKKDQYKDSLIWITFLHMASNLPRPLYEVFVTANKEDYCVSKKDTQPQDRIKDDCSTVNADFTAELNTLVNFITRELRRPEHNELE